MTRDSLVVDQGPLSTTDLHFNGLHFTSFDVIRTSGNPLISQLRINNVTNEINGSTIYCSVGANKTGAPMVTVNVTNEGIIILSFR